MKFFVTYLQESLLRLTIVSLILGIRVLNPMTLFLAANAFPGIKIKFYNVISLYARKYRKI